MDAPSTLLKPRLRLLRRSPSPRIQDRDATPQPALSSSRSPFAVVHDEEDEFPTPRVHPKPIASPNADTTPHSLQSATDLPAETPAARLRALLAREPRSPRPTTTPSPAPSSEADSAAEHGRFGSSTSSVARESLKDIFSRALREPGDTPQKGRLRRNSFDGSSMEITPVVERERGQRRAARRSLSDEEAEKPKSDRRTDPSFRLSTALAFDTLRARLTSSRSQLMDQIPPDAIYDHSSLASTSAPHPQPSTSTRANLQVSAITPHPSFQMSSQLAFQSNLLDQDSEMQRAMGDALSSGNEGSTSAPNVAQFATIPPASRPSSSLRGGRSGSKLNHGRESDELDSSTSSAVNEVIDKEHLPQQEERNHHRDREWNRPKFPSRSSTPEMHRRHSQEFHRRLSQEFRSPSHAKSFSHESLISQSNASRPVFKHMERRGSRASLRSFDDDQSSRPSSIGSQADYRDRISELDREKNYEREREWNRRHPPSRPSSSLSTSSNHSFSHSYSHPPRSPSTTPYLTPTHASLQRKSSRTSLRSDSPASLASSRDSLKEQEQEEKKEIVHERERNWNSPRPHWSISKSPSASNLKTRNRDNNSLSSSSSLTHSGDSKGHGDASRLLTKPQGVSSKVDSSSTLSLPTLHKQGDRSDLGVEESALGATQSGQSKDSSPGRAPGVTSKFGWNFARTSLPPLELDDPADHQRSTSFPSPGSKLSNKPTEAVLFSQIPVRSSMKKFSGGGHATSDMNRTHVIGDEPSSQQDHQNSMREIVGPHSRGEPLTSSNSWSQEDMVLGVSSSMPTLPVGYSNISGSDEESVADLPPQSTTPRSRPPNPIQEEIETDTETEVLTSPSPRASPQMGASDSILSEALLQKVNTPPPVQSPDRSLEGPFVGATPPGTPPSASLGSQLPASEVSPLFALVTPPRPTSFGSSILDFRTPSPPHDLPDLPGPPSSSDDDALGGTPTKDRHVDANSNFTLTKTPRPPGAWATTPLPSKSSHRSSSPVAYFPLESTPPASTSTPLFRANSLSAARTDTVTDDPGDDGLLTPVGTLSRAKSLPLRTPVPPGAWVATPGQSVLIGNVADQSQYGSLGRRKGLLKVRFDVAESETSATEGQPNSPLSAVRLANSELSLPKVTTDHATSSNTEVVVNEVAQSTPTISQRPTTPERPTTPTSRENGPSPRSFRKSPSVRLVDAYGRERVETGRSSTDLPNGDADSERKSNPSPQILRRNLVRIVDAMGREVDEAVEVPDVPQGRVNGSLGADVSVVLDDTPIGHAEALARMRKTLRNLAESLSDTDRSEDIELDSGHLEQLEEVSRTARLARNQLAQNLHLEIAKQHDLHHDNKPAIWTRELLPATAKRSWNTAIVYCAIAIQLLFVLAMWRYAHVEARRLFYTTYYDPLYPELTPIQESSCFSGALSTSRSWTMFDSYETIRREGWQSIRKEVLTVMRHFGDQVWERWGENAQFEKPT